jgi:hypothetical protein
MIRDIPYFNIPATISKNISCPTIGSALVVFSAQSNGTILGWGGSSPTLTLTNLTTATYGTTTYTLTSAPQIMFIGWGGGNYYSSLNGGALTVATNSLVGATTLRIGQQAGEVVVYNDFLEQPSRQILEGYLARKWNITGNLPTTHPYYSTAPTLDTIHDTGSLSIPTLFPSLTMWLDAADTTTVVLSGTSVTNWNDKSPLLDVFSGTSRPMYSYTNDPSVPAVYFSGINSLRGTVNAAIGSGVGSCFMVATLRASAAQILMGGYVTGAATAGNTFGFVNTNTTYISPFQGSDRANQHVFTPPGFQPPLTVLFAQISASVAGGIGAGSVNFATPTNQPYTVGGISYSWNPSLPSSSPWVLGYTGASSPAGFQNFYLHEFLCFSEYFGDTQRQTVEGYIAWKWGIQSQLPAGHPYKNARPTISTMFTPTSIAGLQLWLDAADSSTITGTSSVTAWRDKSGNGYNMNKTSDTFPVTGGAINGLNTVRFATGSSIKQSTLVNGAKNFYWVGKIASANLDGYFFFLMGADGAYNWHASIVGSGNPYLYPYSVNTYVSPGLFNATASQYGGGTTAAVDTNFGVLKYPPDGSLTMISVAGITGDTYYQGLCYDRNIPNRGWCGDLAEVIIFNQALSTTQHQQVEGYLAWKWGLQGSLPSTHPYARFSP